MFTFWKLSVDHMGAELAQWSGVQKNWVCRLSSKLTLCHGVSSSAARSTNFLNYKTDDLCLEGFNEFWMMQITHGPYSTNMTQAALNSPIRLDGWHEPHMTTQN